MSLSRYIRRSRESVTTAEIASTQRHRVLNVGGGSKNIPLPSHYAGWEHVLLDIDPRGKPDVVCDARELPSLPASQYDAIYCSHNLEHYYKHDGIKVLQGFLHVLKPDGFAEIYVPDMSSVMKRVVAASLDIEDVLYDSPSGPMAVSDVIYGWAHQIETSGVDFYAHKTGFTADSLQSLLLRSGFPNVYIFVAEEAFEIMALAFKQEPTLAQRDLLGFLPPAEKTDIPG